MTHNADGKPVAVPEKQAQRSGSQERGGGAVHIREVLKEILQEIKIAPDIAVSEAEQKGCLGESQ